MADLHPTFQRTRPTIEVGDLGAALAFLRDTVGFPVAVVEGEPPLFAIVGDGAAALGLFEVDEPALPQGAACYVTMTGLDRLLERLGAADIPLVEPPTLRPWGMRDIVVAVPGEGPKMAFGEPVAP